MICSFPLVGQIRVILFKLGPETWLKLIQFVFVLLLELLESLAESIFLVFKDLTLST